MTQPSLPQLLVITASSAVIYGVATPFASNQLETTALGSQRDVAGQSGVNKVSEQPKWALGPYSEKTLYDNARAKKGEYYIAVSFDQNKINRSISAIGDNDLLYA